MTQPPIPEPSGAMHLIDSSKERRVFKPAFWPTFVGTTFYVEVILLVLAVGCYYVIDSLLGLQDFTIRFGDTNLTVFDDLATTIVIASPAILIGGLLLSLTSCLPILFQADVVSQEGMTGYNFWAMPLKFGWEEVISVKKWRLPLMPIMVITLHNRYWRVYGVLYYVDPAGLITAVREFAPSDNPLRLFLEQEIKTGKKANR